MNDTALQIFEAGFNTGVRTAGAWVDIDRKQLESLFHKTCSPIITPVAQLGGAPEDLRNLICGVFEHFGMDGMTKVTQYAIDHRGTNAFTGEPIMPAPTT